MRDRIRQIISPLTVWNVEWRHIRGIMNTLAATIGLTLGLLAVGFVLARVILWLAA